MSLSSAVVLRAAAACLAVPLVIAVARYGLAWPPAPGGARAPQAARREAARERVAAPRHEPAVVVYVAGDVARPGLVTLPSGARLAAAVAAAGPRPDADLVAVDLAARAEDGQEIVVPVRGAPPPAPRRKPACGPRRAGRAARPVPPAVPLSLNRASAQELARVPGIGPRLAQRIVAYRETYGPFAAIDDLLDVAGVSERTLERVGRSVRP